MAKSSSAIGSLLGILMLGGMFVICCGLCGGLFNGSGTGTGGTGGTAGTGGSQNTDFSDEVDAQVFAKQAVRGFLKYPHDAEFPWFGTAAAKTERPDMWVVKGTVKAKNAFGAELTHEWTVLASHAGGVWKLASCKIGDEYFHLDPVLLSSGVESRPIPASTPLPKVTEIAPPAPAKKIDVPVKEIAFPEMEDPFPEPEPPPAPVADIRMWSDKTGRFHTEAEFVSFNNGTVHLRKNDGSEITVKADVLSDEDRAWIAKRARR